LKSFAKLDGDSLAHLQVFTDTVSQRYIVVGLKQITFDLFKTRLFDIAAFKNKP
jgi:hypothetical protein